MSSNPQERVFFLLGLVANLSSCLEPNDYAYRSSNPPRAFLWCVSDFVFYAYRT